MVMIIFSFINNDTVDEGVSVYVFLFVCVYVRVCVCLFVCLSVCVCLYVCECMPLCVCVCVWGRLCLCVYVFVSNCVCKSVYKIVTQLVGLFLYLRQGMLFEILLLCFRLMPMTAHA